MPTVIGSSQPVQKAEKKPFVKRQGMDKKQKRDFFVEERNEEGADTKENSEE